jgi:hypothetical protein
MQYQDQLELARQKMAQAQDAFDEYIRTGKYTPERGVQLANALKTARNEYVDQLQALCPNPVF